MKQGKASGTSGVVMEMLLASGDAGLERITSLFNCILNIYLLSGTQCVIVNYFNKHKGEATERGNYRGLKLLEHMMKIFETIIGKEIKKVVDVSEMQFRFMPGRGTIDAIFTGEIPWKKEKPLPTF